MFCLFEILNVIVIIIIIKYKVMTGDYAVAKKQKNTQKK